jgi:DNA-binding NarL/FixJ family response regulator
MSTPESHVTQSSAGSARSSLPFEDDKCADEGVGRDDNKIGLAVIDERPLTRASLSTMLQASGPDFTVSSFSSVAELLSAFAGNPGKFGLVLLSIGAANVSEHRVRECLEHLKQALAEVPVVVLSDCDDTASIRQAFRCGVRGYLSTTLSPPVVIEGLRLVCAGGTFVPADPVLKSLEDRPSAVSEKHSNSAKPAPLEKLTPRQREVLACLGRAKSNKEIACELQMQENTVKIHVRHILQKLKVTNRTHAAVLAYQMHVR